MTALKPFEQRRPYDATLVHLALVLREGVQSGAAADPLYGDALSTALTLHLLREYTTVRPKLKKAGRKLPRQTLLRAVEYIYDQLGKELTVPHCRSGFHESLLFHTTVQRGHR